jgi:PRC-barrel domain
MRTLPITVAALTLLGAAASAQTLPTHNPASPPPPGAGMTPARPAPPKPAVNPLTQANLGKVKGAAVYGTHDIKLGHVADILMNPTTKKVERLVVSSGGVLGLGAHLVALPLDQFSWDAAQDGFKIAQTADSLKSMPAWVEGASTTASNQQPETSAPASAADPSSKHH